MRAFICLELGAETKQEIKEVQQALRWSALSGIRWVRPENYHIILAFFEDINPSQIPCIDSVLQDTVKQRHAIDLSVSKVGGLPKDNRARIVVLEVGGEVKKLKALVKKLRQGLECAHIVYDKKPFIPHITLGRSRNPINLVLKLGTGLQITQKDFSVSRITLFSSEITTTGSVYTQLTTRFLVS